jgi:hypothetical protein
MILRDLITSNSWLSIELTFTKLYPDHVSSMNGYEKVFNELKTLPQIDSEITILISMLMEMTYDEKRELLHFLFDDKDDKGNPFGIYIETRGKGKEKRIDYYMYGRLTGLRTLKRDDINFMGDVDAEIRKEQDKNDNYKTNKPSEIIVTNLE